LTWLFDGVAFGYQVTWRRWCLFPPVEHSQPLAHLRCLGGTIKRSEAVGRRSCRPAHIKAHHQA
jgi:hypothetical protein